MDRANLQRLFWELQGSVTPIGGYADDDPCREVAFEAVEMDAYVAGIVQRLIDGDEVPAPFIAGLRRHQFFGTTWKLRDGTLFDIAGDADLLKHARLIEEALNECLKVLDGVH